MPKDRDIDEILEKEKEHRTNVYFPISEWEDLKRFQAEFKKFSGKNISAAYILRVGSKMLMRSLRVKMTKAGKGVLHAKPRRPFGR